MYNIMIIEDDIAVAEIEKDYLELSDFFVEVETDGQKGFSKVQKNDYDMVILGMTSRDTDGFELCRKIRNKLDVPVIIVSERSDDIDIIRGLALGADDYITIPFSPSVLVARVKAHMSRYERLAGKKDIPNKCFEIGDMKIDKTARRVFVNGEEKIFTSKEFDLLTFLAQNPNHVFTKEELFQKIWGMESVGDVATVTVHIKKIREKLEKDTTNPVYIETLWGVGYRFKLP